LTVFSTRATLDTNIAVYAMTQSAKQDIARTALRECEFLSVQVLNEYANSTIRKRKRTVAEAAEDLEVLTEAVPEISPVEWSDHRNAMRIASRYRLSIYDSLMIAVALAGGASTLYSEDMQHGMVIDGKLTITNPFLAAEPA
jgi:predicted nucleic acid-binding protein